MKHLNNIISQLSILNSQLSISKGFTLIEMLVSVTIIAILAGVSVPVYRNLFVKNDLDVAVVTTAQTLRRAQVLAEASDGDAAWGVKVQTGKISLFKGNSYATQVAAFEEEFSIPTSITIGATSEIVFAKFTGNPTSAGTITLTSTTGDSKGVTVNTKGMVSY